MYKLGLVINPFAGIGGSVGLKGSDGAEIRSEALARGAQPMANLKAETALAMVEPDNRAKIEILTGSGEMGEHCARELGWTPRVMLSVKQPSEAIDTVKLVEALEKEGVDLILFAGGDGTARDIFGALKKDVPVLGIPAGCKIHSGVYALTPKAAGTLINHLISGQILSLREASVMDIDEEAFRSGRVKARHFGSMTVPDDLQYIQATKQGGKEIEALVLEDIAADVIEKMDPSFYYAIGSGTTCAGIMRQLGLANTLLGIDIIKDRQLIVSDANANDLLKRVDEGYPLQLIITLIGGQGHILGRGNQQITPDLVRKVGWENFHIIATKSKLKALEGRPLIVDSGDPILDLELSGSKRVITGYHDEVMYSVGLQL